MRNDLIDGRHITDVDVHVSDEGVGDLHQHLCVVDRDGIGEVDEVRTLAAVDIITSSYGEVELNGNGQIEGAKFAMDDLGQELFVLLDGYDGIEFAELTLNDSLDAAILRLYDGSATHAALISDDDFIVSRDGKSVVLIGGMDDFFGSQQDLDDILQGFSGLGSSLEQFLKGTNIANTLWFEYYQSKK